MPRVRELIPTDKRIPVIRYCLEWKSWDDSRLEKELGIKRDARIARMRDADRFTIGELKKIIHNVPLSPEQISILLGGIQWEVSSIIMSMKGSI